jgi:DNA-binding Lrp family transcriptional regulator
MTRTPTPLPGHRETPDMRNAQAATGLAVANPNPNPTRGRQRHRPRDRYADVGRSTREALDRLRVAEREARADGRTVPASCARVLLEVVGHLTTYSRRNDALSVRRIEEGTGLSRSTVRRALALLEGYGCITRITPENVKGQRTGSTIIALPVTTPAEDELEDRDRHENADALEHHRAPDPVVHLRDTPPVAPRRTRPLEHLDAPATRSTYEKEVRGQQQRTTPTGRPPVGRASARPSASPEVIPPPTASGRIAEDDYRAAQDRMREDMDAGRGVNPADVRVVDAWHSQQRKADRGEVAA